MPSDKLHITIVQPDIVWENKNANYMQYERYLTAWKEKKEIVILPEMFNTGFSMQPEKFAESMDGEAIQWMKRMAEQHKCILTGSLMIEEGGNYFNRLVWMLPTGQCYHYDKRHLFAYAKEDEHYVPGNKRLIVSVNGWKICLMVCYDLRFPVWLRNQKEEYDILVVVANWPERRAHAWKSLLTARAIENMSYVVGVNRVGRDANDICYNGDSIALSPLGETLWTNSSDAVMHTVILDKTQLKETRNQFPFLNDADHFILT
ncbi:MAG TPA: amidohydrolase [Flavipsychrobacter sp.]|nr:amidohydrolase [Flavipsychrobacter sp.]